jgi:hypothetical protein
MSMHNPPAPLVSHPPRLSMSPMPLRLSRSHVSGTAPSASVRERASGRPPRAGGRDAPRIAPPSAGDHPPLPSCLAIRHSTDESGRPTYA